jgi:hypothetical protein
MRVTVLFTLLCAVPLLSGPIRGQDSLDDARGRLKAEADKVEAEVRDSLAEAQRQAKKSIRDAVETLEYLQIKLEITRALSPERKAELQRQINARIRGLRQEAQGGAGAIDGEKLEREFRKKAEELAELTRQIAELQRQGKFDEAAKLERQRDEKYGKPPGRSRGKEIDKALELYRRERERAVPSPLEEIDKALEKLRRRQEQRAPRSPIS